MMSSLACLLVVALGAGTPAAKVEGGRHAFPPVVHESVARQFEGGATTAMVWVFLADKGPADKAAAYRSLRASFDARALRRRIMRRTAPGLFDERDLPVWPAYVTEIERCGATVRVRSRWLDAVSAAVTAGQVEAIAHLPFVTKMQIVRDLAHEPAVACADGDAGCGPDAQERAAGFYGVAEAQLAEINLIALHQEGYTGEGAIIGVLDTGFRRTHDAFNNPLDPIEVVAEHDFVNNDGNTAPEAGDLPGQADHGTSVLGVMAANEPNRLVGGAYGASYILAKAEDLAGEYAAEEDLFVAGLEFIEANGGDVATSSLVIYDLYTPEQLDGMTSVMALGLNAATDNGLHCFQGVGNSGHDSDPATATLVPPADAVDTISVGAVDVNGNIAFFSSDGPTADGRLKPELLSVGLNVMTTSSTDDQMVVGVNGTSFATPLAAAAAACIVQKHPEWTVRQLRAALFQTSSWYVAMQTYDPAYVWGYGILDAQAAANFVPKGTDFNEDFIVDVRDLLVLLGAWGPCPASGGCIADASGDGQVGVLDLLMLLAEWGD